MNFILSNFILQKFIPFFHSPTPGIANQIIRFFFSKGISMRTPSAFRLNLINMHMWTPWIVFLERISMWTPSSFRLNLIHNHIWTPWIVFPKSDNKDLFLKKVNIWTSLVVYAHWTSQIYTSKLHVVISKQSQLSFFISLNLLFSVFYLSITCFFHISAFTPILCNYTFFANLSICCSFLVLPQALPQPHSWLFLSDRKSVV